MRAHSADVVGSIPTANAVLADPPAKGPVRLLCDEIEFPFDPRLERPDVLLAFVGELVEAVGDSRQLAVSIAAYTGALPSADSLWALDVARAMVSLDLGLSDETRNGLASEIHDRNHEINPDDSNRPCDHLMDMLASCASAIRFGLEMPCRSRHAAEAASHVWRHVYGVSRFDQHTPAWQHEWARTKFQQAIIALMATTASAVGIGLLADEQKQNPLTETGRMEP